MIAWWRIALVAWLLVFSALAQAEVAVPSLHARVTDLTDTLSVQQSSELEDMLRAFETRKGSQIAILMVPTTAPETIEQYAIRVVEQWKLGQKGVDNGVLLLIAKQDRVVRIEVGYGLEGAIPDAVAKRIISETMTPHFKQGDFHSGIQAGVEAMMKIIEGEALPPAPEKTGQGGDTSLLFYGLIFVLWIAAFMRALFGLFGAVLAGSVAGVLAWLVLGSAIGGLLVAAFTVLFSYGRGTGGFGGFGGFGGSGSGGGGGFSGGGGGFGGGGASGRW